MSEQIQSINLDQIGYKPEAQKLAVFKRMNPSASFKVVSVEDGSTAYEGKIKGPYTSVTAGEENYIGDFSALVREGTYQITAEGIGDSFVFQIGKEVYRPLFKSAVRFFYLQRCGEAIPYEYGGPWAHPACHLQTAKIYGTEKVIDVSGGWHDAGDYGRYILATAKAAADLMLAYQSLPEAFAMDFRVPRQNEAEPYILEEITRQLSWMLKMQDPISGGVYHKVTGVAFPPYQAMPEEETQQLIVCPISTEATGSFAAVMAMGYELYKDKAADLADTYLEAAEKAWQYLQKTPSRTFENPADIQTGEYGGFDDLGQRLWASAQLFKATGKRRYKEETEKYLRMPEMKFGYGWSVCGAYGRKAYMASKGADEEIIRQQKEKILAAAEMIMAMSKQDGYGITNDERLYFWGSNMCFLMLGLFLMDAYEIEADTRYKIQAEEYVHYCLGKNPLGMCYVTGFGSRMPHHPHHRPSMAKKKAPEGMLVGGPNRGREDPVAQLRLEDMPAAKCYLDESVCYASNEVDIYWNSTLVYVLARLKMV